MKCRLYGIVMMALWAMLGGAACTPQQEQAGPEQRLPDTLRVQVEEAIAGVDALRSGLAGTIGAGQAIDQETFAQVCKPVGGKLKALAADQGWKVQQVAERYRNPAHQLDAGARKAFDRFTADPDVQELWVEEIVEGQTGQRYYRRITVEAACLACHGDREARPDFVKQNYPEDRAFGFDVGALRGLYAVFVAQPMPAHVDS